jgi:DNA-binding NarL/FixJ family response regulator
VTPQASAGRKISVELFWVHPLVPAGFRRVLPDDAFDVQEVRLEPPARGGLRIPPGEAADVSVLDGDTRVSGPDDLSGAILAARPGTRLAVLAERFDDALAFHLLREGTKGLLTYSDLDGVLRAALSELSCGGFWVSRALLARFVDSALRSGAATPRRLPESHRLTAREREVFEDILANLSNKEIGRKRHISARTAQFHVSNVLAKYGVSRRSDLHLRAASG